MSQIYHQTTTPEIDARTGNYYVVHDQSCPWPVSTTIVLAIESLSGIQPTEMCPLNSVIDADSLNAHVRNPLANAEMTFGFYGYTVTVQGDGHVTFAPNKTRLANTD